jgi:Zn-finger nucleic acid-binding protein
MKCPRCSSEMESVQVEGEQIDRCTQCGGLWFDEFELADLTAKPGSEKVDTGPANKSNQYSQARLNCPKCGTSMLRMVDAQQPRIWYETCEECGGSFLDAGEFRDLKKHNLVGKIKDVLIELKGGRDGNAPRAAKLSPEVLRRILQ